MIYKKLNRTSKYHTKGTQQSTFLVVANTENMAEYEDPSKKRRLDEDGTSSAFADSPANTRKEKLESWLKPLNNEQLFKLLLDMCVGVATLKVTTAFPEVLPDLE